MYSNHPPSSSRRSPYEYPQGYDSSHVWPTTATNNVPGGSSSGGNSGQGKQSSYPPRFTSNEAESQEEGTKSFSNRSEYWFDHPTNPYSPPPNAHAHWPIPPPVYQQQQRPPTHHHTQSPVQLPPTPSSTSSSTDISPHVDASKQQAPHTGYPFPVTFQQQQQQHHHHQQQQQQQTNQPPTNHRTPHWRIPATERPFKCDNCPLSFNRNHDLKRHARIHLSVKPFPCSYCDKRFSRKDALKRHMLVKRCGQAHAAQTKSSSSSGSSSGTSNTTSSSSGSSSYYGSRQDPSPQADTTNSPNLFLPPPPVIQNRQSSSILHHHHHGLSNDPSSAQSAYPI